MKTLHDYARVCGPLLVALEGTADPVIRSVQSDSRRVEPGCLFLAIAGAAQDGRAYIADAIAKGAAAVMYRDSQPRQLAVPALRVADDYVAMGRIAELAWDYPARSLTTSAVTGTKGKTTSAYLLRAICGGHGRCGMIGTVEYDLGDEIIPATRVHGQTTPMPLDLQEILARLRRNGTPYLAIEGSSHSLVQGRLGTMPLAAALFTNLTGDHLDFHKTMENYFQAKKLLFTQLLAPQGWAIVNLDDRDGYGPRLARELAAAAAAGTWSGRILGFGRAPDAALRLLDMQPEAGATRLRLAWQGRELTLRSPLTGAYNAANVMGALAAGLALDIDAGQASAAIESFDGVPGRLERVDGSQPFEVYVDYAHTDDALANVLQNLRPVCRGRLICVFGCGGDRDRTKRPRMGKVAASLADLTFVTSDNPRTEDPEAIVAEILAGIPAGSNCRRVVDRREAIHAALAEARPGDIVLLAGKGHEDYQEINKVKHPFLDRAVALEAIRQFRSAPC